MNIKKSVRCTLATLLPAMGLLQTAHAANWFETQTVSQPDWGKAQLLGFVEPAFVDMFGSDAPNGHMPSSDQIAAPYYATSALMLQRIRPIIRGNITPDISYFVAAEASPGAYTYSFGDYAPRLVDADVTFSKLIPGIRLEVGIIRPPGPEGASEACLEYNFLDVFPTMIAQLMQPNFYNTNLHYKSSGNGGYTVPGSDNSGNSGFRYPGVQIENWYELTPHTEVAYGVMLGQYGRQFEEETANGTIFASRLQASYLFNGDKGGVFRNDITGFVWYQQGNPDMNGVSNTMIRDGFGATYRQNYMHKGGRNLEAEYINATGNIMAPASFPVGPGLTAAQDQAIYYPGSNNRADGYEITGGYFLTSHLELNLRYDYYDRLPNLAAQERVFTSTATGLAYHFTKLTKLDVSYFMRHVGIPNPSALGSSLASSTGTVDAVGNELDIWATLAF